MLGGTVQFHFAHVGTDLGPVRARIHAQGAANASGNADEPFEAAQIVLGQEGDRAAKVRSGIHPGKCPLDSNFRILPSQLQHHPGQFPVAHQQIRAAAEKTKRDFGALQQGDQHRQVFMTPNQQQIRRSANSQGGEFSQRRADYVLDVHPSDSFQHGRIIKSHGGLFPREILPHFYPQDARPGRSKND